METVNAILYVVLLIVYMYFLSLSCKSYCKKDYPTTVWNMFVTLLMLIWASIVR